MHVKSATGVPTPFNLDPLSKSRMNWVKSRFPQLKPSGSLVLRRALAHYARHIEGMITDPERLHDEELSIKAVTGGSQTPWQTEPPFHIHPTKTFTEWEREAHQQRLDEFFAKPFSGGTQ